MTVEDGGGDVLTRGVGTRGCRHWGGRKEWGSSGMDRYQGVQAQGGGR